MRLRWSRVCVGSSALVLLRPQPHISAALHRTAHRYPNPSEGHCKHALHPFQWRFITCKEVMDMSCWTALHHSCRIGEDHCSVLKSLIRTFKFRMVLAVSQRFCTHTHRFHDQEPCIRIVGPCWEIFRARSTLCNYPIKKDPVRDVVKHATFVWNSWRGCHGSEHCLTFFLFRISRDISFFVSERRGILNSESQFHPVLLKKTRSLISGIPRTSPLRQWSPLALYGDSTPFTWLRDSASE